MLPTDFIKISIETFRACEKNYILGSYKNRDFLFKNLHLSIEYCVKGILKQNNKFKQKEDYTHSLNELSIKLFDINNGLALELRKVAKWLDEYGGGRRYSNINNKTHSYTEAKNLIKSLYEYCGVYEKYNILLMSLLPKDIFDFPKSSFALEFKSDHICNNLITFELRKMLDLLSYNFNKSEIIATSSYLEPGEESRYMFSIFGITIWLREEELNQLNDYIKIYRQEFLDKMQNIENSAGTLNFDLVTSDEDIATYKVLRMKYSLWKKIIFFVRKNYNYIVGGHYKANTIYESYITFNSVNGNHFTNFQLKAAHTANDIKSNTVTLLLKYEKSISGYYEDISNIEQILNHIISDLIPKTIYLDKYSDSIYVKLFREKYEIFLSKFDINDFALLLNNNKKYSDSEFYLKRLKNSLEEKIIYT